MGGNNLENSKFVYKKQFLALFTLSLLLLMTVAVSATDGFSAEYTPIKTRITPEELAEYNITITNDQLFDVVYSISLNAAEASNWIITPTSVKVNASTSRTFKVKILPTTTTGLGSYRVNLRILAPDQTMLFLPLSVIISLDGFPGGYVPNVALNVDSPTSLDPREKLIMDVLLRNRNLLDITELRVTVKSDLFNKEYSVPLGPRKELTNELTFNLDPLQKPGEYDLLIQVYHPKTEQIIAESQKTFTIQGYSTISPKFSSKESFFFVTDTITLTNDGNQVRSKEVSIPTNWFTSIFLSTDPVGITTNIDGENHILWDVELKPTETKVITITKNYQPLVILIILIIVCIILYFVLRSPAVILKEASVIKKDYDGVSEIKIRIFIKNRSRGVLRNLTIMDRLPRITEFVDSHTMGSLKPNKVSTSSKRGTLLYWDIDALDALEERILTYKVQSKLKIVGDLSMPKARVRFQTNSGRDRNLLSKTPLFIKK